ncbi:MAG: hypothetical protein K2L10_02885 [Ruminococcus sp.]|nr:hypothetical protein [Ruminococcus sp.]
MDITDYIINSKHYFGNEFNEILNYIRINYNMNYLNYESGEDWATISDGQGKLFMVHAKIKIIFTNITDFSETFNDFNVLYFNEYSEKLWSIDINNLPPEFCWHTKAIDRNSFSTQDLYYATI